MNTQLIKSESSLWVSFKRTMYALMVIAVAIAIPLLSYMELSYNTDSNDGKKENTVKVQNLASSSVKDNTTIRKAYGMVKETCSRSLQIDRWSSSVIHQITAIADKK